MSLDCSECGKKISLFQAFKRWLATDNVKWKAEYQRTNRAFQDVFKAHQDLISRIGDLGTTNRDVIAGFNQLATTVNAIAEKLNSPARKLKDSHSGPKPTKR